MTNEIKDNNTVENKSKRKRKRWSEEEDKIIIEKYGNMQTSDLADLLGVSTCSLERRVFRMGLKMTKEQRENLSGKLMWTEEDDNYILENYNILDASTIAENLGRSVNAIFKRAGKLGVSTKKANWTDTSIAYLRENWGIVKVSTICKKFNLTENQVRSMAKNLNLGEESKANYTVLSPKDIAEITGQNVDKINYCMQHGYLNFKYYTVKNRRYRQISIPNFIEYLKDEKHCDLSNADMFLIKPYLCKAASNTEDNIILTMDDELLEYLYRRVKTDRLKNEKKPKNHSKPWSISEERELRRLAESKKYSYKELSEMYDRPISGIRHKIRSFS